MSASKLTITQKAYIDVVQDFNNQNRAISYTAIGRKLKVSASTAKVMLDKLHKLGVFKIAKDHGRIERVEIISPRSVDNGIQPDQERANQAGSKAAGDCSADSRAH